MISYTRIRLSPVLRTRDHPPLTYVLYCILYIYINIVAHVAAGLSNRPDARSHIAVGAMGLPPLHVVCGGAGQLWIPRT